MHSFGAPERPCRRVVVFHRLLSICLAIYLSSFSNSEYQSQVRAAENNEGSTPPLPKTVERFNGMLVGRLASKDIERGTFTVDVDAVSRVWRNSRAENPQDLVRKTVLVRNVTGKWIDVLVTTRIGETIEFECQHDGDGLRFPGEMLRKVAAYKPEDYPRLPDSFRGFKGVITADILRKDPESFELLVKVIDVKNELNGNQAKEGKSIRGEKMLLTGFWNRKELYHSLRAGEQIEASIHHISRQSDHVNVHEFVRRLSKNDDKEMRSMKSDAARREPSQESKQTSADPLNGFRGMLVGRLEEKDIERGTFTLTVDAVPRVWNNNQSRQPKALIGKKVQAYGATGKMLDALVVTRIGETVEFGALHDGGSQIRVGEVLRKTAPVTSEDYPVIPENARGIHALLRGKIVKKDPGMWGMIVEVTERSKTFAGNRAKDPDAIIGQRLVVAGFWNRQDEYQTLQVGEMVEFGVQHQQSLSDAVSVIEKVKKIAKD